MGEHYGLTVEALRKLMQFSGRDGVSEVNKLGGVEEICEKLSTSPTKGLGSSSEHRRATFGKNTIPKARTATFFALLWNVIRDPTIVVLLIFLGILNLFYFSLTTIFKAVCVIVVIVIISIVNYLNARRFERLVDGVTVKREVTVIRKGVTTTINVEDVVVGDVCIINNDDVVPADGIVLESNGLNLDESSLVGKSNHVNKNLQRDPMLFKGSKVVNGSGTMVATAVGINTRKGIIATLLTQKGDKDKGLCDDQIISFGNERSILQQKVQRLLMNVIYVCLAIAAIVFAILVTQFCIKIFLIEQQQWKMLYIQRIVGFVIVAALIIFDGFPEVISVSVAIVLFMTIRKLSRDNKLVRTLHNSDALANVTSICLDKTGTLTTNRMEVVETFICGNQKALDSNSKSTMNRTNTLQLIAENISINSSVTSVVTYGDRDSKNAIVQTGNKTECALLHFIKEIDFNIESIRETHSNRVVHVFHFNSDRKLMGTVIRIADDGYRLFVKGASETVLAKCKFLIGENEKLMEMSKDERDRITNEVIKPLASNRLRTVSLAYRDFVTTKTAVNETFLNGTPNWTDEANVLKNLTCLAVFGINDPIRSDVPELIRNLRSAGITLRIVTGDDINTASSVAIKCGIMDKGSAQTAIDSTEFNRRIRDTDGNIKQHLFDEVYPTLRVLARATPVDKYNLVNGIIQSSKALELKEVVAMIGDGDSDALALKKADVGISFNRIGSDVAMEASSVVITDNKIGGITNAVLWGRHADDSIAKFIQFCLQVKLVYVLYGVFTYLLLSSNVPFYFADLLLSILALVSIFFYDPIAAVGKPHGRNVHIVSKNMIVNIIGQAIYQIIVLCVLSVIYDNLFDEPEHNIEHTFRKYKFQYTDFMTMSLFGVLNARSLYGERNIFRKVHQNILLCVTWTLFALLLLGYHSNLLQLGLCLLSGVGILLWQQVLFFFNSKRPAESNVPEVYV